MKKTLIIATLGVVAALQAHAASLEGQTVGLDYYFPDSGSLLQSSGTAVVGPGVEFPSVLGYFDVDVSDTKISAIFTWSSWYWAPASFSGFKLSAKGITFTSVTVDPATTMAGLDASRISFDANNVWVNWNGLPYTANGTFWDQNTRVVLDVTAVPEPSNYVAGVSALSSVWQETRNMLIVR